MGLRKNVPPKLVVSLCIQHRVEREKGREKERGEGWRKIKHAQNKMHANLLIKAEFIDSPLVI